MSFRATVALLALLSTPAAFAKDYSGPVYYKYTDSKGNQVITRTLPPEAIKLGYDIYNAKTHGHLENIERAPTEDEVEERNRRRLETERLQKWDTALLRKYSRPQEIIDAKERRMELLEGTLTVLTGNLSSTSEQIKTQQARAANIERKGRDVPEHIITLIDDLKKLREDQKNKIEIRENERKAIAAEFDRDYERFVKIKQKMAKKK
ncbi:MAG: hypothetical protein K6L73_10075 [Cellvibrionaceae bacterium]